MKTVTLPDGTQVPALGQGTWYLGEQPAVRARELAALRTGIEHGMTLLDTAEMYGGGRSEELVGEAIRPYDREKLFLVSKVYPHNAGRPEIFRSCENSLRRLGTEYLDLYLLHWRGSVPFAETAECMEAVSYTHLQRRRGPGTRRPPRRRRTRPARPGRPGGFGSGAAPQTPPRPRGTAARTGPPHRRWARKRPGRTGSN